MATNATKQSGRVSWSRDGFFIRLTPERKAKLEGLSEPGAKGSPIQAVDMALDLALAALAESPVANMADPGESVQTATKEALSRMESQARLERENLSAIAQQIAGRFDALSQMLASAMQSPDHAELPSLESWLADESARLSVKIQKVAIAEALWAVKSIGPNGHMEAALDLSLIGIDGRPLDGKAPVVGRARLGGIHPSSRLGLAPMDRPFYVTGQPDPAGRWTLSAFERVADKRLGAPLSSRS